MHKSYDHSIHYFINIISRYNLYYYIYNFYEYA